MKFTLQIAVAILYYVYSDSLRGLSLPYFLFSENGKSTFKSGHPAQRFLPSLLRREEDISKLASLIRSYFALGGHHIQFNIVDTETLYAAQKCPEDYRDLLVRVAGYSDYFNDMNADLQADVIARTEQETF